MERKNKFFVQLNKLRMNGTNVEEILILLSEI